jgi:HK97 gp10 family phage protein
MVLKLDGFAEFDAQLKNLELKVAKGIVRKATRAGAKNTLKQVKANAMAMVGGAMGALIARRAKVFVFKHQRRGSWGVQIGMDPKEEKFIHYSKNGKRSYIPSAIEYGHDDARPIPFIRSAWDKTKKEDIHIMAKMFKTEIEKEAQRGRKG